MGEQGLKIAPLLPVQDCRRQWSGARQELDRAGGAGGPVWRSRARVWRPALGCRLPDCPFFWGARGAQGWLLAPLGHSWRRSGTQRGAGIRLVWTSCRASFSPCRVSQPWGQCPSWYLGGDLALDMRSPQPARLVRDSPGGALTLAAPTGEAKAEFTLRGTLGAGDQGQQSMRGQWPWALY